MSSRPMALSVTVVEGLPQPEPSRKIHHLSTRKKNANPGGVSAKTRTQCYCSHKRLFLLFSALELQATFYSNSLLGVVVVVSLPI